MAKPVKRRATPKRRQPQCRRRCQGYTYVPGYRYLFPGAYWYSTFDPFTWGDFPSIMHTIEGTQESARNYNHWDAYTKEGQRRILQRARAIEVV